MINPILNKGGMGVSHSREESATRLNAFMPRLYALMQGYLTLSSHYPEFDTEDTQALLQGLRLDMSRVSETILACGGRPFTGAKEERGRADLDVSNDPFAALQEEEQSYYDAVAKEYADKRHQVRVIAVLGNLVASSKNRLNLIKQASRKKAVRS